MGDEGADLGKEWQRMSEGVGRAWVKGINARVEGREEITWRVRA
jgi:hypothetical protein